MDKEEYIFLNKKYENAVTAIKAHLFDVISNEEKKAMRIGLEMSREGISEEQYKELQELAMKQGEDLGRVITLTSKLSDVLVRLDTYTRTLRELRKAKASTEEVEKNIQATAAEVIVGINESGTDQNTKDKVIEDVGAIVEAAQVEIPEVASAQAAPAEAAPEVAPEAPVAATAPALETLPTDPVVEAPVAETAAVEIPAVEATPEVPALETTPVVEATPVAETPVATTAPAVEATPVVENAPAAVPAVEETTPLIAVEAAPEAVPAVEATPVVEAAPVEAAPLIPVEEPATEVVPASPAVVEAAPAADASAPLIPVEEPAVPAPEATPVVEAAPVADTSAPLIPVEEPKVEEPVAEAAPAPAEVAPVVETAGPLIPIEEPAQAATTVGTPAAATEEVAAVDNDTVPLIPLPEEVSALTEAGTEEKKEVEVSAANTLPTSPLTPKVPAVDSPSGVVDNPVETQEEKVEAVVDTAPKKEIFTKNDAKNPKALLTSAKQIGNLRKSLSTQDALLGARLNGTNTESALENQLVESGLLPADTETMKKQIEQMMEQANALYKEGKTQEAQELYDKISAMNKQIQEETNKSLSV